MAIEGGMKCVKFIVILLNMIFVFVGIALMTIGALVAIKFKYYIGNLGAYYSGTPTVIAIAGVVIFLVAFFGCCGSFKESYCMISTYAFLLILALILQIGGGIAAFVMRGKVESAVTHVLKESLDSNNTKTQTFIDDIQRDLQCCGSNNSKDWINKQGSIPNSCCKDGSTCNTNDPKNIYTEGCANKLRDYLEKNIGIVAGVALAVCFIQIIGIIFACCLSRSLKEYEYV